MKAILKKCKTRLKSRRGFSLGEVLITVLILLLVTVIVAEGVPTALNAYDRVVTAANAQSLLANTMTKLRNELSTACAVDVGDDDTTIDFTAEDGSSSQIYLSDAKGIMLHEYIGLSSDAQFNHLLISEAASNKNLYVTYEKCAKSPDSGIVTFTNLSVNAKSDDKTLAKIGTYEIRVLSDARA